VRRCQLVALAALLQLRRKDRTMSEHSGGARAETTEEGARPRQSVARPTFAQYVQTYILAHSERGNLAKYPSTDRLIMQGENAANRAAVKGLCQRRPKDWNEP
jgi:hypothetical protein